MCNTKTEGSKGSQKWIQELINNQSNILNTAFEGSKREITWTTPLKKDLYTEYMDEKFLEKLNIKNENLKLPLNDFWPKGGPRWDALGYDSNKKYLIEAKSYFGEMMTSPCRATEPSKNKIITSLKKFAEYTNSKFDKTLWLEKPYQIINRLAHLYFLQKLNSIPTELLLIYFVNDPTHPQGPQTKKEWESKLNDIKSSLGINWQHPLFKSVHDIFISISDDNKLELVK